LLARLASALENVMIVEDTEPGTPLDGARYAPGPVR
jgi:hypothetical protein